MDLRSQYHGRSSEHLLFRCTECSDDCSSLAQFPIHLLLMHTLLHLSAPSASVTHPCPFTVKYRRKTCSILGGCTTSRRRTDSNAGGPMVIVGSPRGCCSKRSKPIKVMQVYIPRSEPRPDIRGLFFATNQQPPRACVLAASKAYSIKHNYALLGTDCRKRLRQAIPLNLAEASPRDQPFVPATDRTVFSAVPALLLHPAQISSFHADPAQNSRTEICECFDQPG